MERHPLWQRKSGLAPVFGDLLKLLTPRVRNVQLLEVTFSSGCLCIQETQESREMPFTRRQALNVDVRGESGASWLTLMSADGSVSQCLALRVREMCFTSPCEPA